MPSQLGTVLEIAAGTGVVTRALASGLEASVEIMASDLNTEMVDHAAAILSRSSTGYSCGVGQLSSQPRRKRSQLPV